MSLASNMLGSVAAAVANQPAPVVLGSLVLSGAEAPSRITIGGRQLAAIHKLPGGARIIDAMGPDDNAVVWQGIFIGPTAASRVRMVDALRTQGLPCTLSFGDYLFEVIVVDFRYSYESRGAVISYSIRAEKTQAGAETTSATALESAIADCATATQFLQNTQASLAAYGGLTGGLSGASASLLPGALSMVGASAIAVSSSDSFATQSQTLLSCTGAVQAVITQASVGSLASGAPPFGVSSGAGLVAVTQQAAVLAGAVAAGGYLNRAGVGLAAANAQAATIGIHS
ncbi:hypothetical protein NFI95_04945 [Acetobacteraceae bacterium KSS8]|uniref:Phage tail protein n=1 Tax=Endosaccharibacter trunci TaxID=2812733 RepID=A0ABT1W4I8_9PROT|nr:hypothetical protein [Acetobacteraceae bacterium KSS8]